MKFIIFFLSHNLSIKVMKTHATCSWSTLASINKRNLICHFVKLESFEIAIISTTWNKQNKEKEYQLYKVFVVLNWNKKTSSVTSFIGLSKKLVNHEWCNGMNKPYKHNENRITSRFHQRHRKDAQCSYLNVLHWPPILLKNNHFQLLRMKHQVLTKTKK